MSSALKNKGLLRRILAAGVAAFFLMLAFLSREGLLWNRYDWQLADRFYTMALDRGHGPHVTDLPGIRYVTITDQTYETFRKNYLDREFMARVNQALTDLGARSIAYDLIFAQPTQAGADQAFADSLNDGTPVFLPVGVRLHPEPKSFAWKPGPAHAALKESYLKTLDETGIGRPFYGSFVLSQYGDFARATAFSGHISTRPDPDGVTRRLPLVVKIGEGFLPALSLSVFLEAVEVPFEAVRIFWGEKLVVPAVAGSLLDQPLEIPMDEKGQAFIPFAGTWETGFEEMPAHKLLEAAQNPGLSGNLAEIFEGNIVFVGDISTGISDLGDIPVQKHVPLIMVHTAMTNAMLTGEFYETAGFGTAVILLSALSLLTLFAAAFKPAWPLYLSCAVLVSAVLAGAWAGMTRFYLVPAVTLAGGQLFMTFCLAVVTESAAFRERLRIKRMFTRYVPQKVVNHLLENPELVKMGGQTREITILMSDLRGFTALSAVRSPEAVIHILNLYLEQMVEIIMAHGGVIDEIIGDGILAFFGAPEPMADHPAKAVACAVAMQQAMGGINQRNEDQGLPRLAMGIGINTGEVIVGNIGSEKRTKYGAVGAQVNFTGRVESYTTGGQILITRSTRDRAGDQVKINEILEVEMKGMAEKVRLYSVAGIGDAAMDTREEAMTDLAPSMEILARKVAGKVVQGDWVPGCLTALSRDRAVMRSDLTLKPMDNLIFHIPGQHDPSHTEVYAKVKKVRKDPAGAEITFTSVSSGAADAFAARLAGG